MKNFISVLLANKTKMFLIFIFVLFLSFSLIILGINAPRDKSLSQKNSITANVLTQSEAQLLLSPNNDQVIASQTIVVDIETVRVVVSLPYLTPSASSAEWSRTVIPGFTATRTPSRANTVVNPTVIPVRTSTAAPIFTSTRTPTRTRTAVPVFTPSRTSTLTITPTRTPTPSPFFTSTLTPTPTLSLTPTATVDGEFRGSGNQKIDISKWQEPAMLSVTYFGTGSFEIISYDLKGLPLSTVVEVSGPYDGNFALNFGNIHFSAIQVFTSGSWGIKILPLSSASILPVPGTLTGNNATVFLVNELFFELSLDAQSASDWVSVIGYGDDGYTKILVSQLAPYAGTIELAEPEIKVLEINITGPWNLDIK